MRILFVTHKQLLVDKNGKKWSYSITPNELNGFAARFSQVEILANVKQTDVIPETWQELSPNIVAYSIHNHRQRLLRPWSLIKAAILTYRLCKCNHYDVVIGKAPGEEGLGGVIGASFAKRPTILRTVADPMLNSVYHYGYLRRKWLRLTSSLALYRTCLHVPVSPHLNQIYTELTGLHSRRPSISIPDAGLTSDFFRDAPIPSAPPWVVVFVGRLNRNKNIITLLQATQLLVNKHAMREQDILIKIVGDGEDRNYLSQIAKQLDIDICVSFEGWVPQKDVPDVLSQSHILVLPSYSEGLGNVVLQAMAAGRPVVASNRDGPKHIVQHGVTGFLFDPSRPEELAEYIQQIIDNPSSLQKMGKAGQAVVQSQYEHEHVMDRWESILGNIS